MSEAATYSAGEALRDGRRAEIRALRPHDRADLITAVGRTSAESFYRRRGGWPNSDRAMSGESA